MNISEATYEEIERLLPVSRGVKIPKRSAPEVLIYLCENGYKWRAPPKEYDDRHVIYIRINRWANKGVLARVFQAMRDARLTGQATGVVSLDSMAMKFRPDGMGALKNGKQAIGRTRGGMDGEDTPDGKRAIKSR